jgi:hypothetical protein
MEPERPIFAAGLLVTAPNGTYGGIRRYQQVAAFGDRIEIGPTKIYYQYLTDLRVYRNVLHLTYAASDGKQVEQFFKYNTFFAKKGAKALAEMATRVADARRTGRQAVHLEAGSSAGCATGQGRDARRHRQRLAAHRRLLRSRGFSCVVSGLRPAGGHDRALPHVGRH